MAGLRGGFWLRLAAVLLDGLLLGFVSRFITAAMEQGTVRVTDTFLNLLYSVLLPLVWTGFTVGKRVVSVQIMREDLMPLTLKTMLMREAVGKLFLGLITFGITIIVSAFMIGLREDKRGIHDFLAGTYVKRI